jgi:hypothetical protein
VIVSAETDAFSYMPASLPSAFCLTICAVGDAKEEGVIVGAEADAGYLPEHINHLRFSEVAAQTQSSSKAVVKLQ